MRDPVVERADEGEQVSDAELLSLIASRELALSWVEDRETHAERATALAKLAFQQAPESAAHTAKLKQAVDALRAGLALAPADPRGWMQLAYLLVLLEGDTSRKGAQALLVSIRTGAFLAPDVLNRRLFWSLAHWSFYDDEERRQIGDQIRLVWRITPGELTDLAREIPDFFAPIASALEKEAWEQFLTATGRYLHRAATALLSPFVTTGRAWSKGSSSFRCRHRSDAFPTGRVPPIDKLQTHDATRCPVLLAIKRRDGFGYCSRFVADCSRV